MHVNSTGAVDLRLKAHGFRFLEKHMAFGGGGVAPAFAFVWSFGCTMSFYQFTVPYMDPMGYNKH